MADRHEVHPHHLLRAVLTDAQARDVVTTLGADPDEVLLTLDRLWLAASDTIEIEEIEARGIELHTVLAAINPPFDEQPDWGGRRLAAPSRDLLVRALAARGIGHGPRTGSGHLLLALMGSKDRLLAATFREHALHARDARALVERWGRRAP